MCVFVLFPCYWFLEKEHVKMIFCFFPLSETEYLLYFTHMLKYTNATGAPHYSDPPQRVESVPSPPRSHWYRKPNNIQSSAMFVYREGVCNLKACNPFLSKKTARKYVKFGKSGLGYASKLLRVRQLLRERIPHWVILSIACHTAGRLRDRYLLFLKEM